MQKIHTKSVFFRTKVFASLQKWLLLCVLFGNTVLVFAQITLNRSVVELAGKVTVDDVLTSAYFTSVGNIVTLDYDVLLKDNANLEFRGLIIDINGKLFQPETANDAPEITGVTFLSDSTALVPTATGNSGTDTQTLAFTNNTASATQTAICLENSQPLTLISSGTLTFSNTDSTTLTLIGTLGDKIIDTDVDPQVQVEYGSDDDTIRFYTDRTERFVINQKGDILFANQGDFSAPGASDSAVLGIERTTYFRLRLTAGEQETFSDVEGVSIDLHGNAAIAKKGILDLISRQAASRTSAAIRFWTNTTGATGGQQISTLITGDGIMGVGNSTPDTNAILDLSNTANKVLLLPTVVPGTVSGTTDGTITYNSNADNAYLRADGAWKPLTFNTVTNQMIFNGEDDTLGNYDNYYVSLIESGNWKVIRYHKTDTPTMKPPQMSAIVQELLYNSLHWQMVLH